jgi:hypothetical protein
MSMSPTTTSTLANILTRTYTREDYIAPHERAMAKFYDSVQEFTDGGQPLGSARYFPIFTADSHATGGVAESGDLPIFEYPSVLQGYVSAVQVAASVAWSELMMAAGQGQGLIAAQDIIQHHVRMTTRNLMTRLNWYTLGHGTGRLATVETTTDTATTFVAALPEGVLQLRKGMYIANYDTDAGAGTIQGAAVKISAINFETRTVTISAAQTWVAGTGIYQRGTYNVAPQGLRQICDNGSLGTGYVNGLNRATYPDLNATVLNNSNALQSYSEKLVRKGINRIFFLTGLTPDAIWLNQGVLSEHYNSLTGSRLFTVTGNEVPGYRIGGNENRAGFEHNGTFIPFKVDGDWPAREMAIITSKLFRKFVLRKPNWIGDGIGPDGSASPYLLQAPASTGQNYALQKIAGMLGMLNIANLQPKANTRITWVIDEELAGDSQPTS